MTNICYHLAPNFHCALENIVENNILDKIIVKVSNACVTLYYAIKTEIKDAHRRVMKKNHTETLVSNVVNDITFVTATFGFDHALIFMHSVFSKINCFTLEVSKSMNFYEVINTLLDSTSQKNVSA